MSTAHARAPAHALATDADRDVALSDIGARARAAARIIAVASTDQKNAALRAAAGALRTDRKSVV